MVVAAVVVVVVPVAALAVVAVAAGDGRELVVGFDFLLFHAFWFALFEIKQYILVVYF